MNIKSEKAKKTIDRVVNYDRLDDAAQRLLYEAVEIAEEEMMHKAIDCFCNRYCHYMKICVFKNGCEIKSEFINLLNS